MKGSFFKGVPVNGIIITALVVFMFQAVMSMYYNNNALMFPNIEAFNAMNKASAAAEFDYSKVFKDLPSKKWANGTLYQVIIAPVCKLAGKSNAISAIYILDLLMFAALLLIFFKIADDYTGRGLGFIATLLFAVSPPVMLGAFSGAETALSMLLFAAAFYHAYFMLPKKKYTGMLIFSALLLLNGWVSAVFGLAFLLYAVLKANEKKNAKRLPAVWAWSFGLFAVISSAVLIFVFINNFSLEHLRNNGLLDVKTWTVDSLFRDGFLWSKSIPMFFTLFFYIGFFIYAAADLKYRSTGIITLTALLTTAALLTGFFATFEPSSRTHMFVAPFYMVLYLVGIKGLGEFAGYMEMKKNPYFTEKNILYGFIMFFLIYSVIMGFNRTIEADNLIQYITGDGSVSKYLER